MNKTEFHIQKEQQENTINQIVQTVKANNLPEDLKEKIAIIGAGAIGSIHMLRQEVYRDLDHQNVVFDQYDHASERNSAAAVVASSGHSIAVIEHEMDAKMAELIYQLRKEIQEPIVDEMTFEVFVKDDEFFELHQDVVDAIREMHYAIVNKNKLPKPLNPRDFLTPEEMASIENGASAEEALGKPDQHPPSINVNTEEYTAPPENLPEVEEKEELNPGSVNQFPNGAPN